MAASHNDHCKQMSRQDGKMHPRHPKRVDMVGGHHWQICEFVACICGDVAYPLTTRTVAKGQVSKTKPFPYGLLSMKPLCGDTCDE